MDRRDSLAPTARRLPPSTTSLAKGGRLLIETSSELIRRGTVGCSVQASDTWRLCWLLWETMRQHCLAGSRSVAQRGRSYGADTYPVLAGLDDTGNSILMGHQPIIEREPPETQVGGYE